MQRQVRGVGRALCLHRIPCLALSLYISYLTSFSPLPLSPLCLFHTVSFSGLQRCLEFGITAVQTNDEKAWQAYCALADEQQLPIRVFLTVMQTEMGLPTTPKPNQVGSIGEAESIHSSLKF